MSRASRLHRQGTFELVARKSCTDARVAEVMPRARAVAELGALNIFATVLVAVDCGRGGRARPLPDSREECHWRECRGVWSAGGSPPTFACVADGMDEEGHRSMGELAEAVTLRVEVRWPVVPVCAFRLLLLLVNCVVRLFVSLDWVCPTAVLVSTRSAPCVLLTTPGLVGTCE